MPIDAAQRAAEPDVRAAIARLHKLSNGVRLGNTRLRDLIEEGRKSWPPDWCSTVQLQRCGFSRTRRTHTRAVCWTQLANETAHVPPLWWTELGNVLLAGERRKRINTAKVAQGLSLLSVLPIVVEHQLPNPEALLALARKHELSCYDATYLELAMRLGLALASKDNALRSAARRVGVVLR